MRTPARPSAIDAMRGDASWREAEPVPVRAQLPLRRSERVDLEWLRQLVHVELLTQRRLVTHAFGQLVGARHRPRRHASDEALDVVERLERLAERSARDAVLARQRVVR